MIKSAWGLRHAKQWGGFFEEKRFTLRRNVHEEPVPEVHYQGHAMQALQKGRTIHGGQGSASRLGGWRPRSGGESGGGGRGWGGGQGHSVPTGSGARVLVQVLWEASGLLSLTPSQPSPGYSK